MKGTKDEMDNSIIVALISGGFTGVVTLAVCLINNHYQQRKADREQDKRMEEISHSQEIALIKMRSANEQAVAEMNAQVQQSIALLDCKFDELTKKVEKHNCLVERTYKLESDMKVVLEKMTVANHRIDDLEKAK